MICKQCGTTFTPSKHGPKSGIRSPVFCSKRCGRKWRYAHPNGDEYQCQHCGKLFTPKQPDRTIYCSRACAYEHRSVLRQERIERMLHAALERRKARVCEECGQPVVAPNAKFCIACRPVINRRRSIESAQRRDKRDRSPRRCPECGTEFTPIYGNKRRVFCSVYCLKRHYKRIARKQRKARKLDVTVGRVNPIEIFERDGWRCQLCGRKLNPKARGTLSALAPELDHIFPLSKGGSHTEDNVQCACRQCNHSKGDNERGQLRLPLFAPHKFLEISLTLEMARQLCEMSDRLLEQAKNDGHDLVDIVLRARG